MFDILTLVNDSHYVLFLGIQISNDLILYETQCKDKLGSTCLFIINWMYVVRLQCIL